MKSFGVGKSQGKVILFGEHAVVYGKPAIVTSLPIFMTVTVGEGITANTKDRYLQHIKNVFSDHFTKDVSKTAVKIESDIPVGSGMGSSAATAAGCIRAFADLFSLEMTQQELLQLVMECERFAHGNASGIDPTAVVVGGLLQFQREGNHLHHAPISPAALRSKEFFLIDSGRPEESTKEMVAQVQELIAKDPSKKMMIEEIGDLVSSTISGLELGRFDPEWITKNERLLEKLEVVSPQAMVFIRKVENIGGYTKMTGAGGKKKGSGMLFAYHPDPALLISLCKSMQYPYYSFTL